MNKRRLYLTALLLLVSTGLFALFYWNSLGLQRASLANGAQFEPVQCWFENKSPIKTECGYMSTRTGATESATFKLPVVVLRHSKWKNSKNPMLHIAGGPGGAAYIDAATMPYWLQKFKAQNWGVDFVLYDQRGTGLSQPFLDCSGNEPARLASLRLPLNAFEDSQNFIDQMRQCHKSLTDSAIVQQHLSQVSTTHSADDIADLHELLGVDQWVLLGVSYGTRLALEVVKRSSDSVHSMILDSPYPPKVDGFETMIENGFKGIDKLLEHCEKDNQCNGRFPDITNQLQQALRQLIDDPLPLSVPRDNNKLQNEILSLTAHRLILLLDYASYDSTMFSEVPAAIGAVLDQRVDDQSLLALASNYLEIELFQQFSEPVYMLTECKENGRFDRQQLMQRLQVYADKYPMLDWSPDAIFNPRVCDGWTGDLNLLSQRYRETITTNKPTLIFSGALDSITPPAWGRSLAKDLPNSRYLEYPNVGHSVLSASLCANDEVLLFLRPNAIRTSFCDEPERTRQRLDSPIKWKDRAG